MRPDASHIRQIKVISNTHWDREFRRSFEKTRRRLLDMMDAALDILQSDPAYHSFTMDGHAVMIDDYLAMRSRNRPLVERLVSEGRLILGPWFTLVEQFSVGHEAIVRNLLWGRRTVARYGGRPGTVAYTPASWGQTGQLPQVLADFGLTRMMFYRGISHDEADAEWVWAAPDGTRVLASRFALYARYNWYYQVFRPVTTGRTFEKDYAWSERDEVPLRFADSLAGEDLAFDLKAPQVAYDASGLREAIEKMVAAEGPHFTTEVFLAMMGHDISVAHPLETRIIADAREALAGKYSIEQTDLEHYWTELEKHLNVPALPVLTGERRSYLRKGMWTYLFPGTISARTYLKQQDFDATARLVYSAEPLAVLATCLGAEYPTDYLDRGWRYLLSNHTHDANGGCAPQAVCLDMEYRYRKVADVADIVVEDALAHVAVNLSPQDVPAEAVQLVAFNPLPFPRDAVVAVDLEMPREQAGPAVRLSGPGDDDVPTQPISREESSAFVDSIWDVPRILPSVRQKLYARLRGLPALGYRVYRAEAAPAGEPAGPSLLTAPDTLANEHLVVQVNPNGTVDVLCNATGRAYRGLNYLSDEGECGSAWQHVAPARDRKYTSLDARADVSVVTAGPLVAVIAAEYRFAVPADYGDGTGRSGTLVDLPVRVEYRLERGGEVLKVALTVDNRARDHWLRANFATGLAADRTWADSHFDVVCRPIAVPDSTGWVEPAGGTHPLRTFVAMSDGRNGLALLPKGLFEYEALDDEGSTLALTLIRACRIKLAVSEEKKAELPDPGVQCPGVHTFEYALAVHPGDWNDAALLGQAAELYAPVRAVMTGRGRGELPHELAMLTVDSPRASHVTCIKQAEDGQGLIVRLFNPLSDPQDVTLTFGRDVRRAVRCRMDETDVSPAPQDGRRVPLRLDPKKIATLRVHLSRNGRERD